MRAGQAVDIAAMGCSIYEMITGNLLPSCSQEEMCQKINKDLVSEGFDKRTAELVSKMIISAKFDKENPPSPFPLSMTDQELEELQQLLSKQPEIDKVQQVETAKNSFINAVNQMTGRNMLSNSEGLTECVEKYRKIRTKRSDLSDKLDEAFEKLITQISPEQSFNTEEDENQFFAKMDQDLFPLKVRLLFDRIK